MADMTVMPREAEWSVADLDQLPDDGLQYEILDGILLVSPAPFRLHHRVVLRLARLLEDSCPSQLEVFVAPVDWQPDHVTSLQPDLLIIPRGDAHARTYTQPLLLAGEVLSPSTRRKDQILKRSKYQDAGVSAYWIVDPDPPSITALDLVDGCYVEAGQAAGTASVLLTHPFRVTVTPSALVTD